MKLAFPKFRLALLSFGLIVGGSALASGCGGDENVPSIDCQTQASIPKFSNVSLLSDVCTGCHDSQLKGADRTGAPANINFDQYDFAKASAQAAVQAVYSGTMPPAGPAGPPTADAKQALYVWGLCGTPQ